MDRQIECHLIILLFICSGFNGMEMLIIERDVIFTPNQTIQVPGKMLYFEMAELDANRNPNGNSNNNNKIDDYIVEQTLHKQWLQPLKHSLYLMLNNKINSNASNSDTIAEERLQRARYYEIKNGRPKNSEFGDVINLANGKLEMDHNGRFQLVEINDNCNTYCLEESIDGHNITAFWSVYKVRHRDEKRGYRFEWKFTIRKLRNNRFDGKRSIQQTQSTRSFLMRDQDYPKYFAERSARNKAGVKMEKRIFNTPYDNAELPFNLDYQNQPKRNGLGDVDNLNTGEYYAKGTPPTIRYPPIQNSGPNQLTAENANNIHQHYFLNKHEVPILKAATFEKIARFPTSVHAIRPDSIHNFNSIVFPDPIRPSQISITPKIHNQIDGYGDILATTSQAPIHFPESIKFQDDIRPTTYRGHYDDNRESILEGEQKRNSEFASYVNRNQLISFPARHTNVIPIPHINTTPSSFGYDFHASTVPSIQSIYNKQLLNPFELSFNPSYWLGGQQPQQQQQPPPPLQNQNFISSFPYNENVFSELDPIYHGPSPITTPPTGHIPLNTRNINGDNGARFVSELPLSHINDDISYDQNPPTEIHQTISPNTDTSFTTPLNAFTTLKRGIASNNNNNDDDSNDDNTSYPDSINAQLPPPDSGTDVRVPYVDTDRSAFSTQASSKKSEKYVPNNGDDSISVEKINVKKIAEKTTTKKSPSKYKSQRNQNSDSAGKSPWTPKRPRLRETDKYRTNSEMVKTTNKKSNGPTRRKIVLRKKTTTTTTEPDTVTFNSNESTTENDPNTTTLIPKLDDEPRTTQSVRKSVSVHFANKVTVMPKKPSKMLFAKRGDANRKLNRVAQIKRVEKADVKNGTLDQ